MPKWKSPIFSDIRNAIGDNVVFSQWKGRPFFRSYVIPANPNTNKQKAVRIVMTNLVKRYQELKADTAVKAEWNIEALPYLVSGYNIFVKWGKLSELSAAPASGAAPLDVTITYICGVPLAKAKLYQLKDDVLSDVTPVAGLLASGTVVLDDLAAATYFWFIADVDVLKSGDTSPKVYQLITKWKADKTNGVATQATSVAS